MCGIAGIVSDHPLGQDDRRTVSRMLDRLAHRGPDGRGAWAGRNAVLGHTRLAVIDPQGGQQPISNEDQTVWIVVNGEIYNYRDLRRQLESRGHRFRTQSDSETALHLYEDLGPACVEHLRGMFALAIWDSRTRRLLLARDPVGIKPLYYARYGSGGENLIFASELTAILEQRAVSREVDIESVHNYLTYHYVPSPKTILRGVSKLAPAQRLVFANRAHSTRRYWNLHFVPPWQGGKQGGSCDRDDDEAWTECLTRSLDEAVRAHLVSDVPLGAFLSGGLDSSAVAATMARVAGDKISTYTAGFDDPRWDERRAAKQLANRLGTDHHEALVRPDPLRVAGAMAGCFDEPFADPSAIPTYYISEVAHRHVKVVLSGDGGDELLAGYTRYQRDRFDRALRPWLMNLGGLPTVLARAVNGCGRVNGRLRAAARNLFAGSDAAHYFNVAWFDPLETRALLTGDMAAALKEHDPYDVLARHFAECGTGDPLARSQYVDFCTWLPDGVLCKVDRASMAWGLEVRVPLLDTQWAALAAAVPSRLKIHRGRGKYILRRAMEPVLGAEIVKRPKRGFEVPLDQWFRGPLHDLAGDTLIGQTPRIAQWLDPRAVQGVWDQLRGGRRHLGARIWALLMLEMWARKNLPQAADFSPRGLESAAPASNTMTAEPIA